MILQFPLLQFLQLQLQLQLQKAFVLIGTLELYKVYLAKIITPVTDSATVL